MADKQFIVFKLDEEEYGLDIINVKEVITYKKPIKVPNSPKFIEGIVNHRGDVMPVINLKKRLNLNKLIENNDTRIIIININEKQIGFLVDEASQTIRLNESEIEKAPDMIVGIDSKYIDSVGKKENRLILIIDLEKVLTDNEKEKIEELEIL